MITMRASNAVIALVELGLREHLQEVNHRQGRGLHVHLGCHLYDYTKNDGEQNFVFRDVHFIVVNINGSYMVFFSCSDEYDSLPDKEKFIMRSCHDSCWRTDGIDSPLSQTYFTMANELNSAIAPNKLNDYCSITHVKYVDVKWEPINSFDTHFKRLTEIKEVEKRR